MWPDREAVARAVDTIRPLRYDGTIGNFGVLVNDALLMTSFHRRAEVWTGPGAVSDAAIRAVAGPRGIEPWCYLFSLYGRPELIELNTRIVTAALEASGAKVISGVHDPMSVNELTLQAFALLNWVGSGGLAWFAPVAPCTGADVAKQNRLARAVMDAHGIDFFSGATLNGREVLNVMPLVFNRDDADERAALARACDDFGVPLFEDDPYRDLAYDACERTPVCAHLKKASWVYQGSFSKSLAPGLRLGYLVASPDLMTPLVRLKQAADLHSNRISQWYVLGQLQDPGRHARIARIVDIYRQKRDLFARELERNFKGLAYWQVPAGGLFFWLELQQKIDTRTLLARAIERNVAFMPGEPFCPEAPAACGALRLNFSHADETQIVQGLATLAELVREELARAPTGLRRACA